MRVERARGGGNRRTYLGLLAKRLGGLLSIIRGSREAHRVTPRQSALARCTNGGPVRRLAARPRELEQATSVSRSHEVDARQCIELPVGHRGGHFGKLRAEEPAEAAALLVSLPLDHLSPTASEQSEWLVLNPELAERVTAVMISDATPLEARTERVDFQHLPQELRQLVRSASE